MTDKIQFQYVVSRLNNGNKEYYGRYGFSADFTTARLFRRTCDAKNSKGYRRNKMDKTLSISTVVIVDPN